jgi:hypothetical protein
LNSSFSKNSTSSANKSLEQINSINHNFTAKLKAAQTTIKKSQPRLRHVFPPKENPKEEKFQIDSPKITKQLHPAYTGKNLLKSYVNPTVSEMAWRRKTDFSRKVKESKNFSDTCHSEHYSKNYDNNKLKLESKNRDLFHNLNNPQTLKLVNNYDNLNEFCYSKTINSDHPYVKAANYQTMRVKDNNLDAYNKQKMETEWSQELQLEFESEFFNRTVDNRYYIV